mgnify:CR=1 FL=1
MKEREEVMEKKRYITPSKKEYAKIEQETLKLLNGTVSGAMATTLFWLAGTKMTRRISLYQQHLFDGGAKRLPFKALYR